MNYTASTSTSTPVSLDDLKKIADKIEKDRLKTADVFVLYPAQLHELQELIPPSELSSFASLPIYTEHTRAEYESRVFDLQNSGKSVGIIMDNGDMKRLEGLTKCII